MPLQPPVGESSIHSDLFDAMGRAGLDLIRERFSPGLATAEVVDVYGQAVERNGSAVRLGSELISKSTQFRSE